MHKGTLTAVVFYKDDFVQSGRDIHAVPAVLVCNEYIKRKKFKIKRSKTNIYIRDNFTCGYCGLFDPSTEKLTVDHIIPRSRWEKHGNGGDVNDWSNLVTSCRKCNINIKGNKLNSECGLKLKQYPKIPNNSHFIKGLRPQTPIPEEWEPYIPSIYKKVSN